MKYRILLFNVLVLMIYGAIHSVWAADTTFTPSIGMTVQYDDNVSFERGGEKNEDYLYRIQPSMSYDYATEVNKIKATATIDYQNYIDNSDYNAFDQIYTVEGDFSFTELLTFFGDVKYINDNTLETELLETGRVGREREDRQRYDLVGGLFFNLTELIKVGGDYQYRQTDYNIESSENSNVEASEDYNDDTISFLYNQRLKNQLDSLSFRGSYSYREVRTHETNTYRASFGWTREISETFSITASVGGRLTEQYTYQAVDDGSEEGGSERIKNDTTGLLANILFKRDSDFIKTELSYRRDQVYEANGGAREVDLFRLGLSHNFTERLNFGVDCSIFLTRDVDQTVQEDSQFYEVSPRMIYNLTEYHRLGIYYSHQYEYDNALEDDEDTEPDADRNRAWVNVSFNFPRKL